MKRIPAIGAVLPAAGPAFAQQFSSQPASVAPPDLSPGANLGVITPKPGEDRIVMRRL
jgi:hypothetical protein